MWDQIRCPVLVLRGAQSDVLMRETAEEMTRRGPRAELVEFPDCGHVPALMNDEQIRVIEHWLDGEKT
jgi:pimeloyl-ACP methyl ester carboxylesterase